MSSNVVLCPVVRGDESSRPIIEALSRAMTARDGFTHQHAQLVLRYTALLEERARQRLARVV